MQPCSIELEWCIYYPFSAQPQGTIKGGVWATGKGMIFFLHFASHISLSITHSSSQTDLAIEDSYKQTEPLPYDIKMMILKNLLEYDARRSSGFNINIVCGIC